MKVSYPHMGYLNIPVNNMFNNLGIEVIETPPITKKTIELGSFYSPEGVCLPYKINIGNFLESIERGADTLINVCGAGKCRLGFYNAVQKIELEKRKNLTFYNIDTNNLFRSLYSFLRESVPHVSRLEIVKSIAMAVQTLKALDAVSSAKNLYGARLDNPEEIIKIYSSALKDFTECRSFNDINKTKKEAVELIEKVGKQSKRKPARIGLIGEFYILLEPYVNHMIEEVLIKQGIEVKKFVYTGDWAYSNTLLSSLGLYNEEKEYLDQAKPYMNYHVGGDGLKSVGSALWCARNNFDGIIHVYPFGCMPEVVAQYALKNLVNDYNMPLLSLSIDEHSSDVGIMTRIEAFADCIKRKNS
ncbi:hypothetical protein [Dendrosporobacter sp. 1207_IL3150]|uniref:hypothetical protein n=1 Tax=Dendrosporobacter sp. 1207_IL3150 TaxID=3084054 RepID=UPI002FDA4B0C